MISDAVDWNPIIKSFLSFSFFLFFLFRSSPCFSFNYLDNVRHWCTDEAEVTRRSASSALRQIQQQQSFRQRMHQPTQKELSLYDLSDPESSLDKYVFFKLRYSLVLSHAPLLRYIYASLCLFLCVPKRFRQHISPRAPKKLIEQNKNPNGAVVIIGLGFPCQCVCLFCALLRWFLLCDISGIQGNKREDYIHCLVWQDPFHHPPSGYIISNYSMICSSITITT